MINSGFALVSPRPTCMASEGTCGTRRDDPQFEEFLMQLLHPPLGLPATQGGAGLALHVHWGVSQAGHDGGYPKSRIIPSHVGERRWSHDGIKHALA